MASSSELTSKERRQILDGLLHQGGVIDRQGKRGTVLKFREGKRFIVPDVVSDRHSRTMMRAEIKRMGLHWPLDPEEKKKETDMPRPEMRVDDEIVPPTVITQADWRPLEYAYRPAEPYLIGMADKEFWTDDFKSQVEDIPGFRGYTGMTKAILTLWFAGFRVSESKPNRNGRSYKWYRPKDAPWPTEFAVPNTAPMQAARAAKAGADTVEPVVERPKPKPPTLKIVDTPTDDDTELSLAVEQEQRAIRAERLAETRQLDLDAEKKAHAETRRTLLVRIANWEKKTVDKDAEINRLRLLLAERAAKALEDGTSVPQDSVLKRATTAEHAVADLKRRLRDAELRANESDRALKAETERLREVQWVRSVPSAENEWWPLKPREGQTIAETMEGAKLFGLEVRVQAKRSK